MVFKFAYFVEVGMDYQLGKFQSCKLSLESFIDRFREQTDDVILLGFENLKFFKLYINYHLSNFKISWLSG